MNNLTEQENIERIQSMSHEEMVRLWRFAPPGHEYFDSAKPFFSVFKARLDSLGGITPEISKRVGW